MKNASIVNAARKAGFQTGIHLLLSNASKFLETNNE